jgi:drug/metabolite transporter (DMT)-like permease
VEGRAINCTQKHIPVGELSHFSPVILCNQQFDCGKGESAAHVPKFMKRPRPGWLFLLLFGSLVGYTLYIQLLRDLGPAKAGSFAFVSPIIAVLVGVVAGGETVHALALLAWPPCSLPAAPVCTAMS